MDPRDRDRLHVVGYDDTDLPSKAHTRRLKALEAQVAQLRRWLFATWVATTVFVGLEAGMALGHFLRGYLW